MRKLFLFLSIISMFFGNNFNLCKFYKNFSLLCKNDINKAEENDVVQHAPSNSNYSIELNIKNTPYTEEIISITGVADKQYKIEYDFTDIEIITSNNASNSNNSIGSASKVVNDNTDNSKVSLSDSDSDSFSI